MDEARIEAATAASLDPSMLDARLLLGKAFFFLELDDQSITTLSATLRRVPRAGETALWLARAYRMADESDKAIATCETLLASDPASVAALRLRATLAMDDDDTASALRYLNMAVEASAETGMAFLDRAAIRWAFGDREGTYADLETAMMTLPRGSHALVEVGRLIDDLKALEP
ncbi:MAG: hypothetical protein JXM71_02160 [Spirochaetales bacterium]|nr:hypothetical protein [Spirochaetales bacterium]